MSVALSWVRERPWTWAVIAGAVCGAVGYGTGRFAGPTKVETKDRIVYETKTEFRDITKTVAGPVRIEERWFERPAVVVPPGCPACPPVQEHTRIEFRDPVVTVTASEGASASSGSRETERVETRDAPRLTLGATVGLVDLKPTYGAFLTYRFAGPFVLLGQGEAGAGTWSARAGVGVNF